MIPEEVLNKIKAKAEEKTRPENTNDEFIPYEWFGGNMDDAYSAGVEDGEVYFARLILDELNK